MPIREARLVAGKYCVASYSIAYFVDLKTKNKCKVLGEFSSDNTGKRFNSEPGLQKVDLLTGSTS